MPIELLPGLALFALVSSITPGPNNLMLMTSGANHGFRRSLPHLLGVGGGFMLMIILVGTGISEIFQRYPLSFHLLRVGSVIYLIYLAARLVGARSLAEGGVRRPPPMSFLQGALFQWVNPKAWAMALTAVSVYAPEPGLGAIVLVAGVFATINLPSVSLWTLLGRQLRQRLSNEKTLRRFNVTMAMLLLVSVLPLMFP